MFFFIDGSARRGGVRENSPWKFKGGVGWGEGVETRRKPQIARVLIMAEIIKRRYGRQLNKSSAQPLGNP